MWPAVANRFLSEGDVPPEQWLGKVTKCKPARVSSPCRTLACSISMLSSTSGKRIVPKASQNGILRQEWAK